MCFFHVILRCWMLTNARAYIENQLYDRQGPAILSDETRLHNDLFYKKQHSHPTGEVLDVTFGFASLSVFEYDAPQEAIVINAFVRQGWVNPQTRWNPDDYGGITRINVRPENTWVPDIHVYGDVEGKNKYNGQLDTLSTHVIAFSNGHHSWFAPIIMTLGCSMNVKDFPFDTQRCPLLFGSYTYDKFKLNLTSEPVITKKYTGNIEWRIESMNHTREEILYPGHQIEFSDIKYMLILKRRSLYLIIKLLGPTIVLTFLALVGFIQPTATGERVVYNISLILMFVWIIIAAFNDFLPYSSQGIPVSRVLLGVSFIAMVLHTVFLLYCIAAYHGSSAAREMPVFLRKYCLERLGSYFECGIKREIPLWRQNLTAIEMEFSSKAFEESHRVSVSEEIFQQFFADVEVKYSLLNRREKDAGTEGSLASYDFQRLHVRLDIILRKLEEKDDHEWRVREWNALANVLLYLLFYIFTGILGVTSIYGMVVIVHLAFE